MMKFRSSISKLFTLLLIIALSFETFCTQVSDNDGSAFITKAEFDALKSSFQAQIDIYNQGIDSKIDNAIASYLSGIRITNEITINFGINSVLSKCPIKHFSKSDVNKWRRPSVPAATLDTAGLISCWMAGSYYPDWSWIFSTNSDDKPASAQIQLDHYSGTSPSSGATILGDENGNISAIGDNGIINILSSVWQRASFGSGPAISGLRKDNFGLQNKGFMIVADDTTISSGAQNTSSWPANFFTSVWVNSALQYYFGKDTAGGTVSKTKQKWGSDLHVNNTGNYNKVDFPWLSSGENPDRYYPTWGNVYHLADSEVNLCYFYVLGDDDDLIIYDEKKEKLKIYDPVWINKDEYSIPNLVAASQTSRVIFATTNGTTTFADGQAGFMCPLINYTEHLNGSSRYKFSNVNVNDYAKCLTNKKCSLSVGVPLFTADNSGTLEFKIKLNHYDSSKVGKKFKVYILDSEYNNTDKLTRAIPIKVNDSATSNLATENVETKISIDNIVKDKSYYLIWTIEGETYGGQLTYISQGLLKTEI